MLSTDPRTQDCSRCKERTAQACEAEGESVCMQATISPEFPASSESESEEGKGFIDDKIPPSHLIF